MADEILEVNGESLENSNHTDVIAHIHNVSKSASIGRMFNAQLSFFVIVHQVSDYMPASKAQDQQ